MANEYSHKEIEKKAQEKWERLGLHVTDLDTAKDPYYLLFEFPYPSGDLHIGHWYAYIVTDTYARYLRLKGKDVLFPIGFDAFGLPAENAAMKHGEDPNKWTLANIERMREQIRSMGTMLDWSKEVVTCSPQYYKFTQWLFARLYEKGLAYRAEAPVKWCPVDKTVLANEQVIDGTCERCGSVVEEKRLTQWFMKITAYAERLLEDLNELPWREDIKDAQRAWIGKSEGARIPFKLSTGDEVHVFTTRPDTIYGATYLVLAPEHPLLEKLPLTEAVTAYRTEASRKTERERSENKEKTGVVLEGVTAINPATKEAIPVYVADYVLGSYGTGAVMAVPAHDERDFEFAKKHNLPITYVIDPITGEEQENPVEKQKIVAVVEHEGKVLTIHWPKELGGRLLVGGTVNEGEDPVVTAMREIAEETGYKDIELVERADEMVHHSYFAFSKNQATLARTTILHFRLTSDTQNEQALEDDEHGKFTVEWVTPEVAEREIHDDQHQYALSRFIFKRCYTGDGLLRNSGDFDGKANRDCMWDMVAAIGGTRETQYRIRDWLVSRQRYWGCPIPVVYDPEGNAHLVPDEDLPWLLPTDVNFASGDASPLASSEELKKRVSERFGEGWTPECDTFDTFVDSSWYFTRYLSSRDDTQFADMSRMKSWLPIDRYSGGSEHTTMHLLYARFFYKALFDLGLVPTSEPFVERYNRGLIMGPDGQKMSKRWGNVVNPDEVVGKYGSDVVRGYLAFIGPYNEPGQYIWKEEGVFAMSRFLNRVYRLSEKVGETTTSETVERALAVAAHKIGGDLERFKTNTAMSALMILVNALEKEEAYSKEAFQAFLILLMPFAPHLAEHLFETVIGGEGSLQTHAWPTFDPSLLVEDTVVIGVQIAGKTRGEIEIGREASEEEAVSAAMELPKVQEAFPGGKPGKVIYKAGKILNLLP